MNLISKINKLLALARDGGATEAEAQAAAAKVQELLQKHNLTMSEVEAKGGSSDSTGERKVEKTGKSAHAAHHTAIMAALARGNFCLHKVIKVARPSFNPDERAAGKTYNTRKHLLVGRAINVQATIITYDYLVEACDRCAEDAGYGRRSADRNAFLEGIGKRIAERLDERCERKKAESRAAQAAAAAGNGTHRELVLSDVYGSEQDLNNDALNSFPPGTTAARRREQRERQARVDAEYNRLVADGVDETEAFYLSNGYSAEQARTYAENWRNRDQRSNSRRHRSQGWSYGSDRAWQRVNSPAYRAGRRAGDGVGLDDQVAASQHKRIGR